MRLDDKYQHMYDELLSLRKKHKHFSKELEGKFKVLRNDFDEWKSKEPKIIIPVINFLIYIRVQKKSYLNCSNYILFDFVLLHGGPRVIHGSIAITSQAHLVIVRCY